LIGQGATPADHRAGSLAAHRANFRLARGGDAGQAGTWPRVRNPGTASIVLADVGLSRRGRCR
jgi:hypothetical protein